MEFHILELTKLLKKLKEDANDILLWAKFINAKTKEQFEMLAEKNKSISQAYQQLQVISQDEQKQLEYNVRQKAICDYNQSMLEATQKGEQIGIEKGIKILILDYLEEGYTKERILQKRFDLTPKQSEQYFQKFKNE